MNDHAAARFRAAYGAHAADVLAYAARRVAWPADAHDVLADTVLVAWRRRSELPPDDEIRPWLFGVARRLLANQRRSARGRSRLDRRIEAALQRDDVISDGLHGDNLDEVRAAMSRLGEHDRDTDWLTAAVASRAAPRVSNTLCEGWRVRAVVAHLISMNDPNWDL